VRLLAIISPPLHVTRSIVQCLLFADVLMQIGALVKVASSPRTTGLVSCACSLPRSAAAAAALRPRECNHRFGPQSLVLHLQDKRFWLEKTPTNAVTSRLVQTSPERSDPQGETHRVDPTFACCPSSLSENPYKSLRVDPDSGSTL
jgi:hypothetical protein